MRLVLRPLNSHHIATVTRFGLQPSPLFMPGRGIMQPTSQGLDGSSSDVRILSLSLSATSEIDEQWETTSLLTAYVSMIFFPHKCFSKWPVTCALSLVMCPCLLGSFPLFINKSWKYTQEIDKGNKPRGSGQMWTEVEESLLSAHIWYLNNMNVLPNF